jgi:hypothetical protein
MKGGRNPFLDMEAWPDFLSNLETGAREEFGMVR